MTQEDRLRHLENALVSALPEYRASLSKSGDADTAVPANARERWFELPSPLRPELQRLIIRLRSDGDIQVEYHMLEKPGSPFEQLFVVPVGEEIPVIDDVAGFVRDLMTERLVLAYARGLFRGGRQFLKPGSLSKDMQRKLQWVTSWRGTYDWQC